MTGFPGLSRAASTQQQVARQPFQVTHRFIHRSPIRYGGVLPHWASVHSSAPYTSEEFSRCIVNLMGLSLHLSVSGGAEKPDASLVGGRSHTACSVKARASESTHGSGFNTGGRLPLFLPDIEAGSCSGPVNVLAGIEGPKQSSILYGDRSVI